MWMTIAEDSLKHRAFRGVTGDPTDATRCNSGRHLDSTQRANGDRSAGWRVGPGGRRRRRDRETMTFVGEGPVRRANTMRSCHYIFAAIGMPGADFSAM